MKSKRFRFIHLYPKRSRYWLYRRFSPEKNRRFQFVTGEENEQLASQIGEKAYHVWLGTESKEIEQGEILFRRFSLEHLERKLARPDTDFSPNSKRTSKNAIENHLIPAFGHLKIPITEEKWEDYITRELTLKPKQKFFNRRKELIELHRRALRLGLTERLPDYRNPDPETEAGKYLEDQEVRKILKNCNSPDTELLVWIMWKQGARPSEALQYEWSMIAWKEGKNGFIHIPARITKTRRARKIPLNPLIAKRLKARQKKSESVFLFPAPGNPNRCQRDYSTGWDTAVKDAEIDATIYDLRRTFITNQAKKGRGIVFVAKYCDTSTKMIEQFYAKSHTSVLEEIAT